VPGGALAVPKGHEVIPVANRWIDQFLRSSELVIATQDWHPPNHSSFVSQNPKEGIWPDHCVQKTHGAEFVAGLNVNAIQTVVRKGTDPLIDSYSGFFDNDHQKQTELAEILSRANVDTVYLLGLATDYCVKFTAMDARQLGLATHVVREGCRGINMGPTDEQKAFEDLRAAGAIIV
jgi:nicotinamidase/pyrazinamidase